MRRGSRSQVYSYQAGDWLWYLHSEVQIKILVGVPLLSKGGQRHKSLADNLQEPELSLSQHS